MRISGDVACVLTVDFLTPLVDDPYDFGRVAAANSFSDVYAMGALPVCALNVLALDCSLGKDVAREILLGGAAAVRDAGAIVAGGHSIDDPEPKYGLVVLGTVHPDRIVRNAGAMPGDMLYLTKPLGTGLLSSAYKIDEIDLEMFEPAIESMSELNRAGSLAMLEAGVHAATDITGFGLAGHLHEMLVASGVGAELVWEALPLLDHAWELSCAYCRPNRTFSIMDFARPFIAQGNLSDEEFDNRLGVLCDPQTSGGILAAVPAEQAETFEEAFLREAGRAAHCIGRVVDDAQSMITMVEKS